MNTSSRTPWLLTAGYVSQRATHTIVARDRNQPLPGPSNVNPTQWANANTRRPLYGVLPLVTTTATTESSGTMNYDSLQVSARKRYSAGIDFNLSYTFSKSLNDALGFFGAGGTQSEGAYWQNGYDRHANYGLAAWDARHNLTFNSNIELPFGKGRKFGIGMSRRGRRGPWRLVHRLCHAGSHRLPDHSLYHRSEPAIPPWDATSELP